MSQTLQGDPRALVESIARVLPGSARDDFRNLMNEVMLANLTALSPAGNLIRPGGSKAGSSAPPTGVTHSVIGSNSQYTIQIQNPDTPHPIYHEVSYSPLKSFTKSVTTLPPTTATNIQLPAPGASNFFRLRSSFDKLTWSPYQLSSQETIDAGLVESSALSAGATFNQTNFAVVSSPAIGSGAIISIGSPSGPFTPYTALKGSVQSLRPSATIVGTLPSFSAFVGWDGDTYQIKSSLAEVLRDDLEPVGAVQIGGQPGGGGAQGGNGGRLSAV